MPYITKEELQQVLEDLPDEDDRSRMKISTARVWRSRPRVNCARLRLDERSLPDSKYGGDSMRGPQKGVVSADAPEGGGKPTSPPFQPTSLTFQNSVHEIMSWIFDDEQWETSSGKLSQASEPSAEPPEQYYIGDDPSEEDNCITGECVTTETHTTWSWASMTDLCSKVIVHSCHYTRGTRVMSHTKVVGS
jgi:hypothetical protein